MRYAPHAPEMPDRTQLRRANSRHFIRRQHPDIGDKRRWRYIALHTPEPPIALCSVGRITAKVIRHHLQTSAITPASARPPRTAWHRRTVLSL